MGFVWTNHDEKSVEKSTLFLYTDIRGTIAEEREVNHMDNQPLATELIRELRASNRRWFIIALVELGIIIAIVAGFLWYLTIPIDEISIENDDGNATYIGHNLEGGLYNGESDTETQTSAEQSRQ